MCVRSPNLDRYYCPVSQAPHPSTRPTHLIFLTFQFNQSTLLLIPLLRLNPHRMKPKLLGWIKDPSGLVPFNLSSHTSYSSPTCVPLLAPSGCSWFPFPGFCRNTLFLPPCLAESYPSSQVQRQCHPSQLPQFTIVPWCSHSTLSKTLIVLSHQTQSDEAPAPGQVLP